MKVLGGGADDLSGDEAYHYDPEEVEVEVEGLNCYGCADEYECAGAEDAEAEGPQEASHGGLLAGANEKGAEYGGEDADGGDEQGQQEEVRVEVVGGVGYSRAAAPTAASAMVAIMEPT